MRLKENASIGGVLPWLCGLEAVKNRDALRVINVSNHCAVATDWNWGTRSPLSLCSFKLAFKLCATRYSPISNGRWHHNASCEDLFLNAIAYYFSGCLFLTGHKSCGGTLIGLLVPGGSSSKITKEKAYQGYALKTSKYSTPMKSH